MSGILALDQGTTSSRALVVDQDGRVLGAGQVQFPQHFPALGWVEHDPQDLFETTVEAARIAIREAKVTPRAIGIANQRETVVAWNRRSMEAVGPAIVWQDRRTIDRCAVLKADGVESMIRETTGLVLDPYFSATKIEWLLEHNPELRRLAAHGNLAVGTVDSWLVAKFTGGTHVTDPTNASRTMLYNLRTGNWDDGLLELFSVPEDSLPRVVPSMGVVGETRADYFGHPIPIAGLAGDQQAALFGQGCFAAGDAKLTLGTGAFLLQYVGEDVVPAEAGLLATAAAQARGKRGYALEGSVFIAGAVIQWLRDALGLLENAAESARLAESVSDTGGVHFVPAFVGLGSPHWEAGARGMITGLTRGTTKAHLVRAGLESIGYSTRELMEAMTRVSGLGIPILRVDGGAAANDWLLQFMADLLEVPVERPAVIETTALGAAGLAGVAVGLWKDGIAFSETRQFETFIPRGKNLVADGIKGWERAVAAALHWARPGS